MQLQVCYFGTYRRDYSRNRVMIESLRRNEVDVKECHVELWQGVEDRVWVASGHFWHPSFLWRVLSAYWRLVIAHRKVGHYDVLVVGYPGHLDVWLARFLCQIRRRPLVMDVFMSPYLVASERGIVAQHPWSGRLLHWFEWLTYRLPDLLIQDTEEYVAWFGGSFGLDATKFRLVPTGADERVFEPGGEDPGEDVFHVMYYGTFIPNHGVMHIMDAALRLRDEPSVHFELIGDGPDLIEARCFAGCHDLANVTFTRWLDQRDLVRKVQQASVCLGAFGATPQSLMTVQNKIYECMAVGKAVITGRSSVVDRHFRHRHHLFLVKRGSGAAIAEAILELRSAPALVKTLELESRRHFLDNYTLEIRGKRYRDHLSEVAKPAAVGNG